MRAIKKLNNNVAICIDGNGDELVAFGKGIGFPKMPYEITDLSKITMTFYKVNPQAYQLFQDIPEDVIDISAMIVQKAQQTLAISLSPNIIFSLADHINFAIVRMRDYKSMQLPLDYDIKQTYETEYQIGRYGCNLVKEKLGVKFPDSEAVAIAMHIVNAENENRYQVNDDTFSDLVERIEKFVEDYFDIEINKNGFTYNRFLTHLRYYLKRLENGDSLDDEVDSSLLSAFKEKSPKVYECTKEIIKKIDELAGRESNNSELFYLMVYVNRIVTHSQIKKNGDKKDG